MGEVGERETIAGASPYPKKLTLSEAYPYIMKRPTIITYGALFMKMLKFITTGALLLLIELTHPIMYV